jgi:dihydroorotate dehydrogenase electron transfer subunit
MINATATVISNDMIKARFGRLVIALDGEAARWFSQAVPGQFAQIRLSDVASPDPAAIESSLADAANKHILLRRPFSFFDITVESPSRVCAGVMYCVLGPGTLRMTTLAEGDHISIIGPLGNGFSIPPDKKYALLVAGGMGAPPLQHLAGFLKANFPKLRTFAFVGANTLSDLPFTIENPGTEAPTIAEFAQAEAESHVATDDGSAGFCGLITECLEGWLKACMVSREQIIIYSCGPEPMLAEVARLAAQYNIDCQVSMERMMACGIGLCQSCAVECKRGDQGETEYKLCCKDGPVFDARDVVFGQG